MPQSSINQLLKQVTHQAVSGLPVRHQAKFRRYEYDHVLYRKSVFDVPDNYTEVNQIDNNIWIGGVAFARSPVQLRNDALFHILNMALEEPYADYDDAPDINVTWAGIRDGHLSPDLSFHHAADIIDETVKSGNRILVHCAAGISRSVTAVIAYYMLKKDMGFIDAMKTIQAKRIVASPHPLLVLGLLRDMKTKFVW